MPTTSIMPIIKVPDPVLRQRSSPVSEITDGTRRLIEDMVTTMYDAPGIGLAAPQVNISERIIVMDCGNTEKPNLIQMINPEITNLSEAHSVLEEGCLSIPTFQQEVPRAKEIELTYQDLHGREQKLIADGLLGYCIQHEIDHLNGKLLVDYASSLKRSRIKEKLMKSKDVKNKN